MTGHQVYSTLHTNSAIGAIPRLLDIGILPDIMAGNIIGVVAQRLIRKRHPLQDAVPGGTRRTAPARHRSRLPPRPIIYRPAAANAAISRATADGWRSWNSCA